MYFEVTADAYNNIKPCRVLHKQGPGILADLFVGGPCLVGHACLMGHACLVPNIFAKCGQP